MSRSLRIALAALFLIAFTFALSSKHLTQAQSNQLFSEDFSDNSHNWELAYSGTTNALNIKNKAMTLELTKEDALSFATPDATFPPNATFTAEITPQKESDAAKWYTGILIRADTRDTNAAFYEFDFGGDSVWTFSTRTAKGETYKIQKSGNLSNFKPLATHKLSVKADGNRFTYSLDGKVLGNFTDSSINAGLSDTFAGVVVGTYKGATDVKVKVTSFEVTSDSASGSASGSGSSTSATPEATKSSSSANNDSSGEVLLEDTFSKDNPNRWVLGSTDSSSAKITADNQLVIDLKKTNWLRWSVPETLTLPNDVDVSVNAKLVATDKLNSWAYGIGVRDFLQDKEEYMYLFEVNNSSQWAFERRNGDQKGWETISPYKKFNVKSFNPKESNALRVKAVGSHFEFFVNGTKVGEADDDTLSLPNETTVALMGLTLKSNTSSVGFTNLSVKKAAN